MTQITSQSVVIPHRNHEFELSYLLRPGHEETVAYLHGLGSSKRDFLDLILHGAFPDYTLFSFDFPGSGNSKYFDHVKLGIADLVELTAKIVTVLGLGSLTLVGHSMGGLTALLFADEYPDKAKRLVSVEGNLSPEDCGVFSRRVAEDTWDRFVERGLMGCLESELAALPYVGARLFADELRQTVCERAFYDYCVSIVEHSDSNQLMTIFEGLEIPRMFIHGEANNHLSYLPHLSRHGILVAEIAGSHHWPHLDSPSTYLEVIGDFITTS